MNRFSALAVVLFLLSFQGCGLIREKQDPAPSVISITQKPMPPEEAKALLEDVGSNFAYGYGLGETLLTIGSVVVFPPYAVVVVGNAALSLSGYEPITVSGTLPGEAGKAWGETYDDITGGPGKVTAAVAGEEFRTREVARESLKRYTSPDKQSGESPPLNESGSSVDQGHRT